jgi:DNA-binding transcriptional regulator YdaS (Cro superfamily)
MLNHAELKAELARRGLREWKLARILGHPPSTFSDWVRGVRSPPADLGERIERALGLRPKALCTASDAPALAGNATRVIREDSPEDLEDEDGDDDDWA